jgi:hypothetical protein
VFSAGLYVLDALEPLSSSCRGSSYASPALGGRGSSGSGSGGGGGSGSGAVFAPSTSTASSGGDMPAPVTSSSLYPLPMEQYGQYYGPLVYSTRLSTAAHLAGGPLALAAHDTVWVFLDGSLVGHSTRASPSAITLPAMPFGAQQQQAQQQQAATASLVATSRRRLAAAAGGTASPAPDNGGHLLQLLVWPFGRNNFALSFGGALADPKGLVGNVSLAGEVLTGWTVHHLCLEGKQRQTAGGGGAADGGGLVAGDLPWQPLAAQRRGWRLRAPTAPASAAISSGSSDGGDGSDARASALTAARFRPFVRSAAEARAQAVIAAAADAATGSGPATAAGVWVCRLAGCRVHSACAGWRCCRHVCCCH